MFYHNFKYNLKILFRNRALVFWTYIFPILLGTLFSLAFSNIENKEKLDIINIDVVNDNNFNKSISYNETIKILSDEESSDRLFNTKYTSLEEAKKDLENNDITGYLLFNDVDEVTIYVNSNGINETVLRYVMDEIKSNKVMMESIIKKEMANGNYNVIIDYDSYVNEIKNLINVDNVKLNDISNKNMSYTMIEYYSLIAMACMYGGMISMTIINKMLPNMDAVGKRVAVSKLSKGKMLLSSLLSGYVVQLIGLIILFIYTILVLNVDYGSNLIYVILLALLGSMAGLSLGMMLASALKVNENAKMGMLIAISMFGSFLAGMMGVTMKYVIDKNVPLLNKINPVNMITDGLYSLYYYSSFNRYYFNIISLVIFSVIMITISYLALRRQQYDSI